MTRNQLATSLTNIQILTENHYYYHSLISLTLHAKNQFQQQK
jgi:hypothetical protein